MNDVHQPQASPRPPIAAAAPAPWRADPGAPGPPSAGRRGGASEPPEARHLEAGARAPADARTTPAATTRAVRVPSNHPELMGDTDDVPERDLSFGDFLDVINPLQHIPIVGTIYRAITGDEISAPASIFGGFLFGGPLGFVVAIANAIVEEASGRDLGETALAALLGEDTAPEVQTAQTSGAGPTPAPPEAAAPKEHPQAPRAATATDPAARQAGAKSGTDSDVSASLTGRAALDAYLRDLRQTGQLAQAAARNGELARADISAAPAPPKARGLRAAARPGLTETRAEATRREPLRSVGSESGADARRDVAGAPVAIQARAPHGRPLDPRIMSATLPASAFAERMFHALDKYQAAAREGERDAKARASALDARL